MRRTDSLRRSPLAKQIKKKKTQITNFRNETGAITTDPANMKGQGDTKNNSTCI